MRCYRTVSCVGPIPYQWPKMLPEEGRATRVRYTRLFFSRFYERVQRTWGVTLAPQSWGSPSRFSLKRHVPHVRAELWFEKMVVFSNLFSQPVCQCAPRERDVERGKEMLLKEGSLR